MTNRLRKPIIKRAKPGLPYILMTANPDGTVRIEGPLKYPDLCYRLLAGGKEAMDDYFAKHPVAAVVAGSPKLEVEHASNDQATGEVSSNPTTDATVKTDGA